MKKLMIAAAVAVLGIAANAAAITWKTSSNFCDEKGNILTSATAPAGNIVLVYLGSGKADWNSAEVVDIGNVAYTVSMGKPTSIATGNFALDPATYANGDIFGVMFKDGDGNLSKLQYVAGGEVATTYTVSGFSDETSTLDAFTFATGNYYAQSVPEPTSGLLLLLGVAGMALRRRRA